MKRPMEQALDVARENLKEIRTVTDWAEEMGYDCPKYFSHKFRNHFRVRPKKRLVELRVEKFFALIKDCPQICCYEIACKLGLCDEAVLNKFINRHTGRSPNKWKSG